MLLDLPDVPADRLPASDLPLILVVEPAAHVVAAIPLEPAARVVAMNPALVAPFRNLPTKLIEEITTIGEDQTAVLMHNDAVVQGLSEADGAEVLKSACAMQLEGIVSKKKDGRYRSGSRVVAVALPLRDDENNRRSVVGRRTSFAPGKTSSASAPGCIDALWAWMTATPQLWHSNVSTASPQAREVTLAKRIGRSHDGQRVDPDWFMIGIYVRSGCKSVELISHSGACRRSYPPYRDRSQHGDPP